MNVTIRRTNHGVEQLAHLPHVNGMRRVRHEYCEAQSIVKSLKRRLGGAAIPFRGGYSNPQFAGCQAFHRGSFQLPATGCQLLSAREGRAGSSWKLVTGDWKRQLIQVKPDD